MIIYLFLCACFNQAEKPQAVVIPLTEEMEIISIYTD